MLTNSVRIVDRRHPEWSEHQLRWRWLLDSLEGGERYRQAIYGSDARGVAVRNLIRHKREYPDPRESGTQRATAYAAGLASGAGSVAGGLMGVDPNATATDDDYELRRARTPIPTFVGETVETYVSKVYGGEVRRNAPEAVAFDPLREWWSDVDGAGTPIDAWFKDTVAPLLLTLGQLDLCFDHPPAPEGEAVRSKADAARLRLTRCVASYVLPENVLWWRLDDVGRYAEVLIRECVDDGAHVVRYRHWTSERSEVYDADGTKIGTHEHGFGVVPIRRVFDRRKPRCRNIGQSRVEAVAELQREYYNRDSELILSDTTQAHPLLQGPEDFVQADGTIPIGPSWLLPKKKNATGGNASYEGFDVVDFPKGGADSIRVNLDRLRSRFHDLTKIARPAGSAGSNAGTVAQSGVSKAYDHDELHAVLASFAQTLQQAEHLAAGMALTVLSDGAPPPDADKVTITYPTAFSLYAAEDLIKIGVEIQAFLGAAGEAPETESALACEAVRKAMKGRTDAEYEAMDVEIATAIARRAKGREQEREGDGVDDDQPPPNTNPMITKEPLEDE